MADPALGGTPQGRGRGQLALGGSAGWAEIELLFPLQGPPEVNWMLPISWHMKKKGSDLRIHCVAAWISSFHPRFEEDVLGTNFCKFWQPSPTSMSSPKMAPRASSSSEASSVRVMTSCARFTNLILDERADLFYLTYWPHNWPHIVRFPGATRSSMSRTSVLRSLSIQLWHLTDRGKGMAMVGPALQHTVSSTPSGYGPSTSFSTHAQVGLQSVVMNA